MSMFEQPHELTEDDFEEMFMRAGNILLPLINKDRGSAKGEKEKEPPIRSRDVCVALAASIQEPQSEMNGREVARMLHYLGLEETDIGQRPYKGEEEPRPPIRRAEVFLRLAENIPNPLQAINPSDIEQLVNIRLSSKRDIFRKSILGK